MGEQLLDTRIPIWLDCDPGHDDACAIVLSGWSPALRLLGISTVVGNQTIEKVTQNALDILAAAGLAHIDVVAGQPKPILQQSPQLCPEVHGDTGLDGPFGGKVLPTSSARPLPGKAAIVMFDRIEAAWKKLNNGEKIRLVCTGALTNAALLLALYPEVAGMVHVTFMGGAMGVGNTGAVAEFNIQSDPEAAKMVLQSGAPCTMIPLEVTHSALVTDEVRDSISGAGGRRTEFRALMESLLLFFAGTYKEVFGFEAPPLHDPCAVAYVIAPHLFKTKHMRVDIETNSPFSRGQTVCDIWNQASARPNCDVALSMDVCGFWELMLSALEKADSASPLNGRQ